MKKLPLIVTLAVLVLPLGGYFLYKEFFKKIPIEPWSLVPQSSVVIYESGNCESCIEPVKQSPIWEIIQKASFYQKETDSIKNIFKFLSESKYSLVSLHATKKDDFDFVFYCRTKPQSIDPTLDQWRKNKHFKISEREFNSIEIHEVTSGKDVFSWAFIEDIWVGSFTPFLIEDVVRVYESGKNNSYKQSVADIYQVPGVEKDAGNLYIRFENFSDWLNVFTHDKSGSFVKHFGKSCLLDIKANATNIVLNGFSSDSANRSDYFLSVFADQSPVPFNFKNLVSQRTLFLASYGISDGSAFGKKLWNSKLRSTSYDDTLKQLSSSLQFDPQKLYSTLHGELALCYAESSGHDLSKILLLGTNNTKMWTEVFNSISDKTSVDTIFYEKYSDYEIRELPVFRFAEKLFSPLISGFDNGYYTTTSNAVLISDNLDALKDFLDDIDKDETWGKSVDKNRFLESTLLESNVSLFINSPRMWSFLSDMATDKWKTFITENSELLSTLDMGAIQFSHLNQGFYTNATLSFRPVDRSKVKHDKNQKRFITNFENNISKIFLVRNQANKSDEIFLQDSTNIISLISPAGEILWSKQMSGEIKGGVNEIDFFGNGKLQYFFFCDGKFHVIDRLGNYVAPYPLSIPVKDVEYVSVVDYDHTRKYRFLIASKTGALWMFDKAGNALDGWKPKKVDDDLFVEARHHRLRGKDYMLAAQKDGNIFLMNRRGETLQKFPVNINGKPVGDYFIESGNSPANTFFTFITKDGFRIKLNLEGRIINRETLLKTSGDAQFSLVPERKNKSYLIKRQEPKQLILTDENGKQILQNDFVGLDPVKIEYVDFGGGSVIITITDLSQNLSFVYTKDGNLLTTPPLESEAITVGNDDAPVKIFSSYRKALSVQTVP